MNIQKTNTYITDISWKQRQLSHPQLLPFHAIEETLDNNLKSQKRQSNSKVMYETLNRWKWQRKTNSNIKEHFLNYLIQDRTNYADFYRIEKHYQEELTQRYKIFNKNKKIIAEKEQYQTQLQSTINNLITQYVSVTPESLINNQESEIQRIKGLIRLKEYEIDCLNNTYSRQYKSNYLIKKRWNDEYDYEKVNEKQCEKYLIIKDHALKTVQKQNLMLEDMKLYYICTTNKNENEINKKTRRFNQLDFEVWMIKNNAWSIEKELEAKAKFQMELKKKLHDIQDTNNKRYICYWSVFKDYHRSNTQLLTIYRIINVKNWEQIIAQFNTITKDNNVLHRRFTKINKDIAEINNQITLMNKEWYDVNEKIKKNKIKKYQSDDDYINEQKWSIKQLLIANKEWLNWVDLKENSIKHWVLMLRNYMIKFAKSLKLSSLPNYFSTMRNNWFKYGNILLGMEEDNNHSYNSSSTAQDHSNLGENVPRSKRNSISDTLDQANKADLFLDKVKIEIDIMFLRGVTGMFNDCINNWFLILSSCINIVSYDMITKEAACNINIYTVMNINSETIVKRFQSWINVALLRQIDKDQIFSRTEKEIFRGKIGKSCAKIKKLKSQKIELSHRQLYNKYVESFRSNKELNDSGNLDYESFSYWYNHPTKSVAVIGKYTNEFVNDQYEKELLIQERKKEIKEKTDWIKQKNEQKELKNYIIKKLMQKPNQKDSLQTEEIYNDEEDLQKKKKLEVEKYNEELINKKKSKRFSMCFVNEELNKMYTRFNDLRQWERHYFKERDKFTVNVNSFNEIYAKFKKRYFQKPKMVLKKKDSNNSQKSLVNIKSKNTSINDLKCPNLESTKSKNYHYKYKEGTTVKVSKLRKGMNKSMIVHNNNINNNFNKTINWKNSNNMSHFYYSSIESEGKRMKRNKMQKSYSASTME